MAIVFRLEQVRGKDFATLSETFSRYRVKLPVAAKEDLRMIAGDFEAELKNELLNRFPELYWRGRLLTSIQVKDWKDGFYIPIAVEGLLMEYMRPHWAPVMKPSPFTGDILWEWVLEKLPLLEKIPHVMMVRPHPWLSPPIVRAENKIVDRLTMGKFHDTIEKRGR